MTSTKNILITAMATACLFAAGCDVQVLDGQDIEIDVYDTQEQNLELARALMSYDSRHWAQHIPAFNQNISPGIRFNANASPNGSVQFRVTYDLSGSGLSSAPDQLETQFAAYVTKLAAEHAAHEPLFLELAPLGMQWADRYFTGDIEQLLQDSAPVLGETSQPDQLTAARDGVLRDYGTPQRISFLLGQYYAPVTDEPRTIALMYHVDTEAEPGFNLRVILHELDREWLTAGFGVYKTR